MKHIYLNLKRFDIPRELGGVNDISPMKNWGGHIVTKIQDPLKKYEPDLVEFAVFFPEAHLIPACEALSGGGPVQVGCQGVFREDTGEGGGFGAFTTNRTANSMKGLGCTCTIIGHCEERRDKADILAEGGVTDAEAVNRLLNREIKTAVKAGLRVLYCIGESAKEQPRWQEVLKRQLDVGLEGIDKRYITVGYEPVWAIGPGKIPPDREYISMVSAYIKDVTGGIDVVYGGGLKADNARMLASIPTVDGGLIALTRFQGQVGFYPEEYLEIVDIYMDQLRRQEEEKHES